MMRDIIIDSPVHGQLIDLSDVKEDMFSSGALGRGAAVAHPDSKVYAPFDGVISVLFPTDHAIGIYSKDGIGLLIHIGIDTVELRGQYFYPYVKKGDTVEKGQLLMEFDAEAIQKAGYDMTTPIVVTNFEEYDQITITSGQQMVVCLQ